MFNSLMSPSRQTQTTKAVRGGSVGLRAGPHGEVSLRLDSPINNRFLKTLLARAFPEQRL